MMCPCGGQTAAWVTYPQVPIVNDLPLPGGQSLTADLELRRCMACGTVQVINPPPPEVLFPPDYPYQSGVGFEKHAAELARQLAMGHRGELLDIGSNDGTFVRAARAEGFDAVGLDPARPEADYIGFFPVATREFDPGSYDVITALNVFAHIPDPAAFAREACRLLKPRGVFVVEVVDLAKCLAGARLDMFYHEHPWTWSRTGVVTVLEAAGFDVLAIEPLYAQGGSMRVWARPGHTAHYVVNDAPWHKPSLFAEALAKWNLRIDAVRHVISDGGRWAGYGAAAKGHMFAYHAKLGPQNLAYVVDEGKDKQGRMTPYGVPIVAPEHMAVDPPDGVLILAWNYAPLIREKLREYAGWVMVV
jgi:SAM-dependent methyltransferase